MKIKLLLPAVIILLLTVITLFVLSCSKKSVTPAPTVYTPLSTFISSVSGTLNPAVSWDQYEPSAWSLGYQFKPTTNGHVTALGCSSPQAGTYTVQLYLLDSVHNTGTLLVTDSVSISANEVSNEVSATESVPNFQYVNLPQAVPIMANTYYRIAYSTSESNPFDRLHFQTTQIPFTASNKNIVISNGCYGSPKSFPETEWATVVYMADVKATFP